MSAFSLATVYGEWPVADDGTARSADGLALTTPVGATQDRRGNVWLADTGASRLLVVDGTFERVLTRVGAPGSAPGEFDLPFRFAHHPDEPWLYVTDMGNGRVQRLAYTYDGDGTAPSIAAVETFTSEDGSLHPNGVAVADYADGVRVFVADEFHSSGADLRSRVVVFDEAGGQRDAFRAVERDGTAVPLYWPQGLAVDGDGHLYVANTGRGVLHAEFGAPVKLSSVVRCTRGGDAVDFPARGAPVLDDLPMPRDVAVLDGESRWVVVPDAATGRLHVYDDAGLAEGTVPAGREDDVDRRCPDEGLGRPDGAAETFAGPVAVAPFDAPAAGGDWRGPETASLLLTEALEDAVGSYELTPETPTVADRRGIASSGTERRPFSFATGSAMVTDADGRPFAWIADGTTARLQRTGPGLSDALQPVDVPANRFPFGVAVWPPGGERTDTAGGGAGRLFVSDYTTAHRGDEAPQVHVYAFASPTDGLAHVASFGEWGVGNRDLRLPRGLAVDPLDDRRARVYVADSGNGRVARWEYDRAADAPAAEGDLGTFGHADGMFWNPSDVAVGECGLYVADENNNRIQRFADGDWRPFGGPGYDDGGFLLPVSVATCDGYLFVVDLVNRRLEAFREPADPVENDPGALDPLDAVGRLGGSRDGGEFWMPYFVSARGSAAEGIDLVVPDASLNVAYRFAWTDDG